ncbi:Uma2 family endonuclease [Allostreptomyces psammosilenae]|uniref:Uma2 family endonuclease n=1 Tax=Allostreptomyces psammosilenae TaxID=1892865 RepID=A0A852ZVS7_9ACTN|nr:Uma2 family endonuclease [Allostreptomyces psammosilenae]NYI04884.1 Uma2 family endonuclease [Allostreptomyces psammosilenae]
MTVPDNRLLEIFESFDFPEGVRVEYIGGEIIMQASALALHDRIGMLIAQQVPVARFDCLIAHGVRFDHRDDRPEPDVIVFDNDLDLRGVREIHAGMLRLAVEICSESNFRRDVEVKPALYAEGGIANYLIVNPREGTWTLLSKPKNGEYVERETREFGIPIQLPEPLGFTIDTSRFQRYPS